MKLFKGLLIIGIIFLLVSASWAQELEKESAEKGVFYISLNDALKLALINNFDVQLAFYDRWISQTDIDKEKSIYDTVLTLTGEYDYDKSKRTSTLFGNSSHTGIAGAKITKKFVTGTDVTLDFQNTRESTDVTSFFSNLNPSYESSLEMKFTQPLLRNFFGMYDWGGVLITKIDVNNFSLETLDKIEKNLADVEKAYWNLVLTRRLVEIRKEMYKRAVEFYSINEEKKKLGTSELTDLLAAEANKELRRTELKVEEDNFSTAVNKLRLLINHPRNNKELLPIDKMEVIDRDMSFLQNLKTSFNKRRDYKRAKEDIKAKKIKFNMEKNARWPQLDLEGSLKLNGIDNIYNRAAAKAFTTEHPEYYAKLTFSFPFEDREARSKYNKAKHQKAKALLKLKKVEKTIVTQIDDKTRRVNLYRDKALKTERIEGLQKKKLQEEEKKFRYGRSDSDRIIRFQEDYLGARIQALRSLKEYKDSLIDLYLAKNIFLEKRSLTVQ